MAADAAAAAAVELDEVLSGAGGRCCEVWLPYIAFAASVASCEPEGYEAPIEPEYDGDGECALVVGLIFPARSVFSVRDVPFACRCFCVLMPSKIWFATAIDIPQKSGTKCTQWA